MCLPKAAANVIMPLHRCTPVGEKNTHLGDRTMDFANLRLADAEIYAVMEQELGRQRDHIELIASENFTSPAVMELSLIHI